MRILVIDEFGEMCDFAMRAHLHEHDVKWYIRQDEKTKEVGKGLAPIVRDYKPHLRWADLIVLAENTKYLKEMDSWRDAGKLVVGATQKSAEWELDRGLGQDIFKKHKIPVIPYETFSDYDKAIAYVKKHNERFVSKPTGDEPDKALSYVAKSPADMVFMLERWKKMKKHKAPFIMQRFVKGIEMAVGGWFGPNGFNAGWCENFEFKKLMNGEMGPNTGEQGTVLHIVGKSNLAKKVLQPLEEAIAKTGHVGYIDVNCIIDEEGTPWPLEFTMRNGYPTFNIQYALHDGDPVEWLYDLANGDDAKNFRMNEVATGIVMTIPDYPYSRYTGKQTNGIPLYGVSDRNFNNIHPCQMQLGVCPVDSEKGVVNKPSLMTAGDYILVASATGETVRKSADAAYRLIESLDMPASPMWRTDIGNRLARQIPKLQDVGFAESITYS